MFNGLAILKTASALAGHASARQAVIARNIANADTPGYAARDLGTFEDIVGDGRLSAAPGGLRTSRAGHFAGSRFTEDRGILEVETPGDASPNGNTVSLESEMIRATEVRQQHDLALATYRGGLDLLRTALGRGR